MRKILVIGGFKERHLKQITDFFGAKYNIDFVGADCQERVLVEKLKEAEIVVGQPDIELLQHPEENCPNLKFIQMTCAGTDHYTRSSIPFPKEQVLLANCSGAYGLVMSQFVVGMILSVMLNFKDYHSLQQKHVWERRGPVLSLDKAKVLIFGAGDIGTAIAKRLTGFDSEIIGVCRNTEKERPNFDKLCTLDEAEKYLPEADVVIGCIPNTKETEKYLNRQRLKLMKDTSVIVNVGRGNFIDCMALDELLRNEEIWGAALDVTDPEPLPVNHPLWDNPKCMITPHSTGATFGHLEATEDLVCDIVCSNLNRYCNGDEINNQIYF